MHEKKLIERVRANPLKLIPVEHDCSWIDVILRKNLEREKNWKRKGCKKMK